MTAATDREVSAFATALRQARLAKSLSAADLARQLRLSDTQVLGLESDDLKAFYGPEYARRAALRCAAALGVDPSLDGVPPETVKAEGLPPPSASFTRYRAQPAFAMKPVWIGVGLVAACVLFAGFLFLRGVGPQAATVVETPAAPVPLEPSAPADPVTEPVPAAAPVLSPGQLPASAMTMVQVPDDIDHRFYLVVVRDVTIHALDATGTVLISGFLQAAPGQRVVGEPPFTVQVSDEDAVEIYFKGQRVRSDPNRTYEGISLSTGLASQAH